MAILNLGGCGGDDKENTPPAPPSSSAARGVAVKNRAAMKRPGVGSRATRRRPPLRDITGLFLATQCRPPPAALDDVEVAETLRAGANAPAGVTLILKQGRYSLRKEFR